jgi:type II secretory pathway component PulF
MNFFRRIADWIQLMVIHHWVVSWALRRSFYRHVALLNSNHVTLIECVERFVERLERHRQRRACVYFRKVIFHLHNGADFSQALSELVPESEYAMISVGMGSDNLSQALLNCINHRSMMLSIRKKIGKEVVPVLANVGLAVVMLFVIATRVQPVLGLIVNPNSAGGVIGLVFSLCAFVTSFWALALAISVVLLFCLVLWLLPNWQGPRRLQAEYLPIFSHYRDLLGVIWLSEVAALMSSHVREMAAIELTGRFASPWLKERIEVVEANMAEGLSFPKALQRISIAGVDAKFPDPNLVSDLDATHGFVDSADRITALVHESSIDVVNKIASSVSWYGALATLFTVSLMICIIFATFEIQNVVLDSVQSSHFLSAH